MQNSWEPSIAQVAELRGVSRSAWNRLSKKKQDQILIDVEFVKRWSGAQLFFAEPLSIAEVRPVLEEYLRRLLGSADVVFVTSAALAAKREASYLEEIIAKTGNFAKIKFGSDVAEKDAALLDYFISTKAFERVSSGVASVVIGPKGSGKTAILRAVSNHRGDRNSIVITPEVFATSMLRQVVDANEKAWDEDQAFVSTWVFTILLEVFKRVAQDPHGVPPPAQKKLRAYLRDNANFQELDLFTRFIGYLKRIEGVKVGPYELTLKTKMLQELYSLAPLYELVPLLRGGGGQITILLDELDQGWDNSPHANRFVASLLQAAIKIQTLGLKACVIAFLRSEIFDLIKGHLDQLDKLRSSIDVIRWSEGEMSDMLAKRIAHSLAVPYRRTGHEMDIVASIFESGVQGMSGFRYLLSRTTHRPREVLQFISHAHRLAVDSGSGVISAIVLDQAEYDFSSWKVDHICAEYAHIYPRLRDLLDGFRSSGPVLSEAELLTVISSAVSDLAEDSPTWLKGSPRDIFHILYSIDFIGTSTKIVQRDRVGVLSKFEFAYQHRSTSIRLVPPYLIHPAFWKYLEIAEGQIA